MEKYHLCDELYNQGYLFFFLIITTFLSWATLAWFFKINSLIHFKTQLRPKLSTIWRVQGKIKSML